MKSAVETLDDNKVKLSIELAPEEFEADLSATIAKLGRELKLPGFRKGKVPRQVIENRLGKEYTRSKALEEALPKYYMEALRSNQVDAIAEPELELTSEVQDEVLKFDAVVEVRPEVQLAGYGSLRVEVPSPAPSDEELTTEIDRFRENFGTLETVTRPAAEKDRVVLDLHASYNGETFEPLQTTDFTYAVGSNSTGFKDFDSQLVGSQAGHIFEFNTDHPQEAGGVIRIKTLVKQVQQNNLPELTDEFVAESTEFATVAEFRSEFVERLAQAKRQHSARSFTQNTEDALNQLVDETLPEALVAGMTQQAARSLVMNLQAAGMDLGQYLQATQQNEDSFAATMRAEGEKMAKLDLALRAVAKAENLLVSDDELYETYDSMLAQQQALVEAQQQAKAQAEGGSGGDQAGQGDQAAKGSQAGKPDAVQRPPIEELAGLRTEMLKRNAFEWVCQQAEIVDEAGNRLEYRELFPEPEATSEADTAEAGAGSGGAPEATSDPA